MYSCFGIEIIKKTHDMPSGQIKYECVSGNGSENFR